MMSTNGGLFITLLEVNYLSMKNATSARLQLMFYNICDHTIVTMLLIIIRIFSVVLVENDTPTTLVGPVTIMAGRKAKVSPEEAIKLIEKYIKHFTSNNFPSSGHVVWKNMSKDVGGRWTPGTAYNQVREDRRGYLTQARVNQGIGPIPAKPKVTLIEEDIEDEDEELYLSEDDEDYVPDSQEDTENLQQFDLLLSNDDWNNIKPDETAHEAKNRLKKQKWASIVSSAFIKRYNLECAFNAKSSYVISDPQTQREKGYFLKFKCYCKDQLHCKNVMFGVAESPPTEKGLRLLIKTVDTRSCHHTDVKRHLSGTEREEVKKKLLKQTAGNYRDELLKDNMEFGENVPPTIRENHVYRQVRMEANKEQMGLKPKEKVDVIRSIQRLATSPQYDRTIHQLGGISFYVIYSTLAQMFAYLEYVRLERNNSRIAIDATGKIVKPFEICPGKKTGHVFLFTVTVNYKKNTFCVYQMISEIHTQEFIEFWLKFWTLRLGASSPGEVISDYERAIPMASSLTFNNMSLKQYVDTCFLWATAEPKVVERPVKTLIRIDVAHIMHLASRWKSVQNEKHPAIRNTRLHCIALMVDSRTVDRFSKLFLLLCIISLHPYLDTITHIDGVTMKVSDALNELQNTISSQEDVIMSFEESRTSYEESKGDQIPKFDEGESGTLTHQFVKKLIKQARPLSDERGKEINAFYSEEFVKDLERLGKEFPLWTGIMRPDTEQHASSAHQEGYFSYMRNTIFEFTSLPCAADRFVKEHIDSTQSGTNLFAAKLKHASHEKPYPPSSHSTSHKRLRENTPEGDNQPFVPPMKKIVLDDSDLKTFEPWGGLGNPKTDHDVVECCSDDGSDPKQEIKLQNDQTKAISSELEVIASSTFESCEPPDTADVFDEYLDGENSFIAQNITLLHDGAVLIDDGSSMESPPIDCSNVVEGAELKTAPTADDEKNRTKNTPYKAANISLFDHSYAELLESPPNGENVLQECSTDKKKHNYTDSKLQLTEYNENPINKDLDKENFSPNRRDTVNTPTAINTKKQAQEKSQITKPKGFFFRPNPELKLATKRPASRQKGFLLANGNICRQLIKIKRNDFAWNIENDENDLDGGMMKDLTVRVLNTCGFDAILHILQFIAIDYPDYNQFITNSENETLNFLKIFMKTGVSLNLYRQRLKLLNKFQPIVKEKDCLRPCYLDGDNNIITIWDNLFASEPSAYSTYTCDNDQCIGKEMRRVTHLNVDENVIKRKGYTALRQALLYYPRVDNITCRQQQCSGITTEFTTLNMHICIELDIRQSNNRCETMECSLSDFPYILELEKTYRLGGIVHYDPLAKHFTAYCLRSTGDWIHCDDLRKTINYRCKDTTIIRPQIAVYIISSN